MVLVSSYGTLAMFPKSACFGDAWMRSHNGGPIDVSLNKARSIQFRKIKDCGRT
jgi:hypothetical protein